jgi:hypothetical protein
MQKDALLAERIYKLTGTPEIIADHQAATDALRADEPGDYKYGVRVEDAESGEVIGDDDPVLIVF